MSAALEGAAVSLVRTDRGFPWPVRATIAARRQ